MEELYIKTPKGLVQLPEEVVRKYNLKEGSLTPFTRERVVNRFGEYHPEPPPQQRLLKDATGMQERRFTTAENLDIARGSDSYS